MPSISEIINIAKISQYLATLQITRKGLYGGGTNVTLPRLLYMVRKNVEWAYGNDNNYEDIQLTANYLYTLCAPFNTEASYILAHGTGGGAVSPVNPSLGTYLIPIMSVDFTNATEYDNPLIVGKQLEIFWNDIPRYLNSDEYGMTSTGIEILVPGFDATINNYTFKIYIVN